MRGIALAFGLMPPAGAAIGLIFPSTQFAVTVLVVGMLFGLIAFGVARALLDD